MDVCIVNILLVQYNIVEKSRKIGKQPDSQKRGPDGNN